MEEHNTLIGIEAGSELGKDGKDYPKNSVIIGDHIKDLDPEDGAILLGDRVKIGHTLMGKPIMFGPVFVPGNPRGEVYNEINLERDYQDIKFHGSPNKTIDQFAELIDRHATKLRISVDPVDRLHNVRKIAALCVAAGEIYGMPPREEPSK